MCFREDGALGRKDTHQWLPAPVLAYGFVLALAAVQESPLLLLQEVLEPLELVDVEGLQADQLLSHDQRHLLGRVHASVPGKHPQKQGMVWEGPRGRSPRWVTQALAEMLLERGRGRQSRG